MLLAVAMTASQLGVIFYPMPQYRYTDEQYEKGWEVGAFSKASDLTPGPLRQDQVGATMNDNRIALSRWRALSGVEDGVVRLRIVGTVPEGTADFDLLIEDADTLGVLATAPMSAGTFDITVSLAGNADYIHINAPEENTQWSVLRANRVYLLPAEPNAFVYAEDLEKIESHGLTRVFSVSQARRDADQAGAASHVLEVPMVGNMFLVARQDGVVLESWSDLNNRMNVRVANLGAPVEVRYQIPLWIWLLTLAGLLAVLAAGLGRSSWTVSPRPAVSELS